ncbi:hypothetical protein IOC61_03150 [Halomonas sp. KAO]|uniref:hypothetical protein n=1 Tax=Halomonas sp. KAO TaxID=2783858 RepID=UPI00189CEDE6|nr:hypothetical protein [Halomonas sp. KAO]MBF7052313.1 hypothetical protein [Halomonas sp. KAO]
MQQYAFGKLAMAISGQRLPVRVMRSAAGYYLGTQSDLGPVSRESVEYWPTEVQAASALSNGEWSQRLVP